MRYEMKSLAKLAFAFLSALVLLPSSSIQEVLAASSPANNHRHAFKRTFVTAIPRGGGVIPAGYNPFGYKITALGEQFLTYEGSLECDVGRLLSTLKSGRKRYQTLKDQWLEVLRVSKSGQNMRIYRMLQELLDFCVQAGFVD